MKKFVLCFAPFVLAACSAPEQQSSVPMDMQAVQDYQYRVSTGKTIDKNNPSNNEPLNQSDSRPKTIYVPTAPRIYPSVGYGWSRHGSGIGVGLGSGYWY